MGAPTGAIRADSPARRGRPKRVIPTPDGLEPIQISINWLRMAHFTSFIVEFFRRSCWLRLQNPPRLKQNGLILAQS